MKIDLSVYDVAECHRCKTIQFYPDNSRGCRKCGVGYHYMCGVKVTKKRVIAAMEFDIILREQEVARLKKKIVEMQEAA